MMTDGRTPLFIACQVGHAKIVEMLLDKARDTINVNYLYKFILFRFFVWFGFTALCRSLFRRRVTPTVWVAFATCCWMMFRHTMILRHPADVIVISTLLSVWRRAAGSVFLHR